MPNMYELAQEVRDALLEAVESEQPDEAAAKLESIQASLERRVEWVGLRVLEMGHEIDGLKAEAARLSAEASTRKRQQDWLKQYIGLVLTRAEMKRVDGTLCKARRQKSPPSVLLSVEIEEAAAAGKDLRDFLPEAFVRVIPESTQVDKRALLEYHKTTGELPPGVEIDDSKESVVVW